MYHISNQSIEVNVNSDRLTPDSEGFGSSISNSPSSYQETNNISPLQKSNYYSTPNSNQYYYNYQNQFYNQTYQQPDIYSYQQNHLFNDSNYYSRNSSINQTSQNLNDSFKPEFLVPEKPLEQKPFLKFSIDAILGLDKKEESKLIPNELENNENMQGKPNKSVKRKNRKSSDNSMSNKRMRTIFTQEQLDKLEEEFLRQQYMVGSERSYLANSLGLTESQVKIWFQNRRIKWRKSQGGILADKSNDELLNQSCSNSSFIDE